MSKQMLISAIEGQEVRIAIVQNGVLDELYFERASSVSRVGNIYKGRVTNVEASIQAAFVDFGFPRNGFLHVSDLHPKYFPGKKKGVEPVGRKRSHRHRPPIQKCLHRGDAVVVQVTKEGIGTKGPTLTTYLSIPGRLLVMMPGMSRLGISRKIEDEQVRAEAKAVLSGMKLPSDVGFILRTAGIDRSKRDLQRDFSYLNRLWNIVSQRMRSTRAPAEIYQESDLVARTLRDVYTTDVERVICDSERLARRAREFLNLVMPRGKHRVELYTGTGGLFHDSGLEAEIERIYAHRVELPLGGSLIIDQTEALVAIDVNSGTYRKQADAETTALKTNLEAAGEIARQLRLRDLGGVIIIDFIDMRHEKNRRAVEKALRDAMKGDRAKATMLRMSRFGIVELTRQRVRPSLAQNIYTVCSQCRGEGMIKSPESLSLQLMRTLRRICSLPDVARVDAAVSPQVAHHLSNAYRERLCQIEQETHGKIFVTADAHLAADEFKLSATNARGGIVAWDQPPGGKGAKQLQTVPLAEYQAKTAPAEAAGEPVQAPPAQPKAKRRKRRRGGRRRKPKAEGPPPEAPQEPLPEVPEEPVRMTEADEAAAARALVAVRKALFGEKPPAAPPPAPARAAPQEQPPSLSPAEILAGEHRRDEPKEPTAPEDEKEQPPE